MRAFSVDFLLHFCNLGVRKLKFQQIQVELLVAASWRRDYLSQTYQVAGVYRADSSLLLELFDSNPREVSVPVCHSGRNLEELLPDRDSHLLSYQHELLRFRGDDWEDSDRVPAKEDDSWDRLVRLEVDCRCLDLHEADALSEKVYGLDFHFLDLQVWLQVVDPVLKRAELRNELSVLLDVKSCLEFCVNGLVVYDKIH